MLQIDEPDLLTPDQRAVLSLVLERDKSYAEVADMLAIPESAVRERAHAALDALARSEIAAPAGSAGAPSAGHAGARSAGRSGASSAGRTGAARSTPALPSSRRGGALLLGGIVLVAAVVAIVLSLGGKGSSGAPTATRGATSAASSSGSASSSSSAAAKAAAKVHIDSRLSLAAAEPGAGGHGEAYVLSDGKRRAFYVAAQGMAPSKGFFYAVWLYNSPSSSAALGRAPTVGSDGRMEGGGPLPSNATDYAKLIVTRETSTHTSHPGPIVLSGPFSLH